MHGNIALQKKVELIVVVGMMFYVGNNAITVVIDFKIPGKHILSCTELGFQIFFHRKNVAQSRKIYNVQLKLVFMG